MSYDWDRSSYEPKEIETPSGRRGPFQGRWKHSADPQVLVDPIMGGAVEMNLTGKVREIWLEVGPRVQEPIERKRRQVE